MRVTKHMFQEQIDRLSEILGQQMYLVDSCYHLYVTPCNNDMQCQYNHCFSMSANYSRENYDELMAFIKGVSFGIQRANIR